MSEDTYRDERIRDMRLALDYLEATPEIPMPYFGTLNAYCNKEQDIGELARAMKPVEKVSGLSYYTLRRQFGTIKIDVNFDHEQVCEKVVISTEEVPARLVEAYTREVVEWKCPESLLDDENPADTLDEDAPVITDEPEGNIGFDDGSGVN